MLLHFTEKSGENFGENLDVLVRKLDFFQVIFIRKVLLTLRSIFRDVFSILFYLMYTNTIKIIR